jgi:hypothetical protein
MAQERNGNAAQNLLNDRLPVAGEGFASTVKPSDSEGRSQAVGGQPEGRHSKDEVIVISHLRSTQAAMIQTTPPIVPIPAPAPARWLANVGSDMNSATVPRPEPIVHSMAAIRLPIHQFRVTMAGETVFQNRP